MEQHRLMRTFFLAALVCSLAFAASADGLPELKIPDGLGVNIHFTAGHSRDLDMIAAAGFKWVRQDFFWTSTERQKGQYDWSEYDTLTADLDKRGLRAYYILDYSNPLYETSVTSTNPVTHKPEHDAIASPQQPESVAAFVKWAAAAAEHFRGRSVIWEICRTNPTSHSGNRKPDAAQYTTLALATAKAIRAADPHACIVAPATSGFQWDFLETVLSSGLPEYLDAVSVHPYRGNKPETAAVDFARLRELIKAHAPAWENHSHHQR